MGEPPAAIAWLRATGTLAAIVFWGAILWGLVASHSDHHQNTGATGSTTSAPRPYETMTDGTYRMGGLDGQDWGIWQSDAATADCFWSIVAKDPYAAATILDNGTAAAGQSAKANVQPLDGHDLMFQTHGCGTWHLVS